MSLDPVKNFAKGTLSTGISSTDTSLTLQSGDGDKFPDPSSDGEYNCVIWNSTDYGDPADDPDKEIVRVTAKSTDTFTITRGQEGTSAVNHNTSGKTYKMILAFTKKSYDDINTQLERMDNLGGDLSNTIDNATVETVGGKSKTDIADAVDKKHTQNTDQYLDYGGSNQVSASDVKEVVDLAPNLMEKVSEVNVSSNCTYVDFTGLDGNSAWFYKLFATIKNPTANNSPYYLFVNGDTTTTNYYYQVLSGSGSTVSASRGNEPNFIWLGVGEGGLVESTISQDTDSYFRFVSAINRYTGGSVETLSQAGCKTATITNITSLRVQASVSNGIGAGSKLILFKVRKT